MPDLTKLRIVREQLADALVLVDGLIAAEEPSGEARPDLRIDWCPECLGQRSIRLADGVWSCVVCGTRIDVFLPSSEQSRWLDRQRMAEVARLRREAS